MWRLHRKNLLRYPKLAGEHSLRWEFSNMLRDSAFWGILAGILAAALIIALAIIVGTLAPIEAGEFYTPPYSLPYSPW